MIFRAFLFLHFNAVAAFFDPLWCLQRGMQGSAVVNNDWQ